MNKFKTIGGILVALVVLPGCMYQEVDSHEIALAEKMCTARGGVRYIRETFAGDTTIICVNGARGSESMFRRKLRTANE